MRIFKSLYRAVYVLLSGGAILSWLGVLSREYALHDMVYFTTQSSLLCFLYFAVALVFGKTTGLEGARSVLRLKGALTMSILITGILFAVLPGPDTISAASCILHYVCPAMVFLDYLLFDEKGLYRLREPILWLAIPSLYVVFALVRGAVGGHIGNTNSSYPYPFLDPAKAGNGMMLYIAAMLVGFLLVGYLILLLDRMLAKRNRRTRT